MRGGRSLRLALLNEQDLALQAQAVGKIGEEGARQGVGKAPQDVDRLLQRGQRVLVTPEAGDEAAGGLTAH